MSRMLRITAAFALAAVAAMPCGDGFAQQAPGFKIPQARFNRPAFAPSAANSRSTTYTLGRLQRYQTGLANVRTAAPAQIIQPPRPILGYVSK